MVAEEYRISKADKISDGGQEAAAGPLVAVVHVGGVHQLVILGTGVESENESRLLRLPTS